MEAVMGSSSYSPFLKLVSCGDKKMGSLCFKDDLFLKSSTLHYYSRNNHNNNKNNVNFKLSISVASTPGGVRPVSLSSSHTQEDVENNESLIEESPNGYTRMQRLVEEAEAQTVRVKFQLQRECSFGQNFLIAGEDPMFGLWDPKNAIPLSWSDGHLWTVDLDIPIGKCIKFKFIMQERNGEFVWQPGPDRLLECFETEKNITLCEDWENPDSRIIIETDPTLDQVEGSAETEEIQTVAANEVLPGKPIVSTTGTQESEDLAINLEQVLVSDEGVPVLVPGLSQLPVNEGPKHEPEPVNGAAMVSTGADIAMDLKLPELDMEQEADTSNSNPTPETSSNHENQDSCHNEHQEMQQIAEEQDYQDTKQDYQDTNQDDQDTQPIESLLLNVIQWGNNVMHKLFNIFGIQ